MIQITEEMIERGAQALARHTYHPSRVKEPGWPPTYNLSNKQACRNKARIVLEAALGGES